MSLDQIKFRRYKIAIDNIKPHLHVCPRVASCEYIRQSVKCQYSRPFMAEFGEQFFAPLTSRSCPDEGIKLDGPVVVREEQPEGGL